MLEELNVEFASHVTHIDMMHSTIICHQRHHHQHPLRARKAEISSLSVTISFIIGRTLAIRIIIMADPVVISADSSATQAASADARAAPAHASADDGTADASVSPPAEVVVNAEWERTMGKRLQGIAARVFVCFVGDNNNKSHDAVGSGVS